MKNKLLFLPFMALSLVACGETPPPAQGAALPELNTSELGEDFNTLNLTITQADNGDTLHTDAQTIQAYSNGVTHLQTTSSDTEANAAVNSNDIWIEHQNDQTIRTTVNADGVRKSVHGDSNGQVYAEMMMHEADTVFEKALDIFEPFFNLAMDYSNNNLPASSERMHRAGSIRKESQDEYTFNLTQTDLDTNTAHEIELSFQVNDGTLIAFNSTENVTTDAVQTSYRQVNYDVSYAPCEAFSGEIPALPIEEKESGPIFGADLPLLSGTITSAGLQSAHIDGVTTNTASGETSQTLAEITVFDNNITYIKENELSAENQSGIPQEEWLQYADQTYSRTVSDGTTIKQDLLEDLDRAVYLQAIETETNSIYAKMLGEFQPIYDLMLTYGTPEFETQYPVAENEAVLYLLRENEYLFTLSTSDNNNTKKMINAQLTIIDGSIVALDYSEKELQAEALKTRHDLAFRATYGNRATFDGVIPEPDPIPTKTPITGAELPTFSEEPVYDGVQAAYYYNDKYVAGTRRDVTEYEINLYQDNIFTITTDICATLEGGPEMPDSSNQWGEYRDGEFIQTRQNNGGKIFQQIADDPEKTLYDFTITDTIEQLNYLMLTQFSGVYDDLRTFVEDDFDFIGVTDAEASLFALDDHQYLFTLTGFSDLNLVTADVLFTIYDEIVHACEIDLQMTNNGAIVQEIYTKYILTLDELPEFTGVIPDPDPVAILGEAVPAVDLDNIEGYTAISLEMSETLFSDTGENTTAGGEITYQMYQDNISHTKLNVGGMVQEQWAQHLDSSTRTIITNKGAIVSDETVEDLDMTVFNEFSASGGGTALTLAVGVEFQPMYELACATGTPEFEEILSADEVTTANFGLYQISPEEFFLESKLVHIQDNGNTLLSSRELYFTIIDNRLVSYSEVNDQREFLNGVVVLHQQGVYDFEITYGGELPEFTGTLPSAL